jgi:DNA-binding transcriptional LysR family regulator
MDATQLPWADLQVFLASARGGSLVEAARRTGTSPATVMRRLRALESALSCQLFTRSTRGIALTPAGQELLSHVESIEHHVLAAQRRIAATDQRLSGVLRVATVDDLLQAVLAPVVSQFARRHPGVCLDLVIGDSHSDLARRAADVAIRPGARPDTAELIARRVCPIAVALYAASGWMAVHGPPSLQDAAYLPLVRADEGRRLLPMEVLLERHGAAGRAAVRSNSMVARSFAIRDGLGVGLLPCFLADREPGLVRIGPPLAEAGADLWVLMHADLRRNARVRAFAEFAFEQLWTHRHAFAGQVG